MNPTALFLPVTVTRRTGETRFAMIARPRADGLPGLHLPNRLLSHFIDHWSKAAGIDVVLEAADWPGSWEFDHVLCEDLGQLVGRVVAAIHDQRAARCGVAGRARASCCMDDAACDVALSFEARPRASWHLPRRVEIDGFVDAWYEDGRQAGVAYGTNLRQFLDGFSYGSGVSLDLRVTTAGNLHHLYEVIFRGVGDAIGQALGTANVLPGDSSGLAGTPEYRVQTQEGAADAGKQA